MRNVTRTVCKAFIDGKRKTVDNTHTDNDALFLHWNMIARRTDGHYYVTLAGWPTVTTRERLNGLCQLLGISERFYQSRHTQYFGGEEIDPHEWICLTPLMEKRLTATEAK